MIEYFFFGLTEIDSLGKCHIWHSSKLFLPRQWSSEESSYRGIKVARHVTEDTSCLTSYFSFFLPTFSIPYVVSRVYHCRFTMLHMQASFCQANQFGTKQPRKSYTQHWICGFSVFWQVYIRRSYQAYELTTLYHEKVPSFSFLSSPPHSYCTVMLAINFHQVQWLSSNEYLYWTNEGRS